MLVAGPHQSSSPARLNLRNTSAVPEKSGRGLPHSKTFGMSRRIIRRASVLDCGPDPSRSIGTAFALNDKVQDKAEDKVISAY
ncbi:MAG: hypothetical protein C5B50_28760 [Verrucomicrobia bacterium]|nr:MAG: hypothetical protein C5B50_28760 [Verrucomicrobiota bacterium]